MNRRLLPLVLSASLSFGALPVAAYAQDVEDLASFGPEGSALDEGTSSEGFAGNGSSGDGSSGAIADGNQGGAFGSDSLVNSEDVLKGDSIQPGKSDSSSLPAGGANSSSSDDSSAASSERPAGSSVKSSKEGKAALTKSGESPIDGITLYAIAGMGCITIDINAHGGVLSGHEIRVSRLEIFGGGYAEYNSYDPAYASRFHIGNGFHANFVDTDVEPRGSYIYKVTLLHDGETVATSDIYADAWAEIDSVDVQVASPVEGATASSDMSLACSPQGYPIASSLIWRVCDTDSPNFDDWTKVEEGAAFEGGKYYAATVGVNAMDECYFSSSIEKTINGFAHDDRFASSLVSGSLTTYVAHVWYCEPVIDPVVSQASDAYKALEGALDGTSIDDLRQALADFQEIYPDGGFTGDDLDDFAALVGLAPDEVPQSVDSETALADLILAADKAQRDYLANPNPETAKALVDCVASLDGSGMMGRAAGFIPNLQETFHDALAMLDDGSEADANDGAAAPESAVSKKNDPAKQQLDTVKLAGTGDVNGSSVFAALVALVVSVALACYSGIRWRKADSE